LASLVDEETREAVATNEVHHVMGREPLDPAPYRSEPALCILNSDKPAHTVTKARLLKMLAFEMYIGLIYGSFSIASAAFLGEL
jgi:hypothetical protein